jgi:hypothetical protein
VDCGLLSRCTKYILTSGDGATSVGSLLLLGSSDPFNPAGQLAGFFCAPFFQNFLEIFWGGLFCQSFDKTVVDFLNYLLGITEVVGQD